MDRSQQNFVRALKLQIESLKRIKEADDQHLDKLKSALEFVTQQRDELNQQTSHLNRQIQSLEAQLADTQELLQDESRQKLAAQAQARNFQSDLETIKDQSKETTEQQLKYENELVALRAQLAELSRHEVYGFFNVDKHMIYVGQTTDFNWRISRHLGIATGNFDKSEATPFHKNLGDELKRGVYIISLFDGLTELEANDIENGLVLALKETDCCENITDGRWTQRFLDLDDTDRALEIDGYWAEVINLIQNVPEGQLVTLENYKARFKSVDKFCACGWKVLTHGFAKCARCAFIKQKNVECKRKRCETMNVGTCGYCWNCYSNNISKIQNHETLPPLQTKYSTKGFDYNTSFQRALVLSMKKLGGKAIKAKIESMFLKIKMVNQSSIDSWIREKIKPIENADDLAKFLRANQPSYSGLTSDMIDHLLVYEYSLTQDAKVASKRLIKLFFCIEDKDKFSLSVVQDKFANIETIKQSLKRAKTDENEPVVEAKKAKVE